MLRWLPIALAVLSNVLYHLGQRAVPRAAHPVAAVLAMYGVAALGTVALLPFVPPTVTRASVSAALHWSVVAVGLAIVGVELAFLFAYRLGWEISTLSLSANVLLAAILVPIGVFAFREPWSVTRLVGLILSVVGLWLLSRK